MTPARFRGSAAHTANSRPVFSSRRIFLKSPTASGKANCSPENPATKLVLDTEDKTPAFSVTPDNSRQILSVDIYFTQQDGKDYTGRVTAMTKYWQHAPAKESGGTWTAALPLFSTDRQLWVYANPTVRDFHFRLTQNSLTSLRSLLLFYALHGRCLFKFPDRMSFAMIASSRT